MRLMQNFTLISVVCVVCDMNEVVMSYMGFVCFEWGGGAWGMGGGRGVFFHGGMGRGVFLVFWVEI